MQNDRLKVALTRRLPDVVEKRLAELFDVRLRDSDTPLSADLIGSNAGCRCYCACHFRRH